MSIQQSETPRSRHREAEPFLDALNELLEVESFRIGPDQLALMGVDCTSSGRSQGLSDRSMIYSVSGESLHSRSFRRVRGKVSPDPCPACGFSRARFRWAWKINVGPPFADAGASTAFATRPSQGDVSGRRLSQAKSREKPQSMVFLDRARQLFALHTANLGYNISRDVMLHLSVHVLVLPSL